MKNSKKQWNVVPNDKVIVAENIKKHKEGGYTWNEVASFSDEKTARLVSAAPDMLAALEAIEKFNELDCLGLVCSGLVVEALEKVRKK